MTTSELAAKLKLTVHNRAPERTIEGAIVSDLLSDILANGQPGYVWITIQTHRNVAAVASAQQLAAVIITMDRLPAEDLLTLATSEQVTVYTSPESSYTVAGLLYSLGVR